MRLYFLRRVAKDKGLEGGKFGSLFLPHFQLLCSILSFLPARSYLLNHVGKLRGEFDACRTSSDDDERQEAFALFFCLRRDGGRFKTVRNGCTYSTCIWQLLRTGSITRLCGEKNVLRLWRRPSFTQSRSFFPGLFPPITWFIIPSFDLLERLCSKDVPPISYLEEMRMCIHSWCVKRVVVCADGDYKDIVIYFERWTSSGPILHTT